MLVPLIVISRFFQDDRRLTCLERQLLAGHNLYFSPASDARYFFSLARASAIAMAPPGFGSDSEGRLGSCDRRSRGLV